MRLLPCPCVSAETLKGVCTDCLHLLAADYEVGSSCSQFPDLGDMWRCRYPNSLDWDGNVG